MINNAVRIILPVSGGFLLGIFYFGGLWITILKGISSKKIGLWFISSAVFRISGLAAGFYLIADHELKRLLICILGFFASRFFIDHLIKTHQSRREPIASQR